MTSPAQRQAGYGQIAAVELVESLVADRSESGRFERRVVDIAFDSLPEEQRRAAFIGLADIASAAVVAWHRRDPAGTDLYLAMRRMLAGRMTGEDEHEHGHGDDDELDAVDGSHSHAH
jgi:hypothetical protein